MNENKKFFSKIGVNYLILGITALSFQIIIANILSIANPHFIENMNILSILSAICNYILPFPIFYWLMKKIKAEPLEKQSVNVKTFITYIGITITLMWIGNIIGLVITSIVGVAIQNDISNPVSELINSSDILLNLLIISIIGPVFEEIFFRKLLIDRSIKYGAKVSIILSAVIFALFHGNLNQFFYTLLMGGFFAYVYIKTGKIIYPIILHSIINLMGSVISLIIANSIINIQTAINPTDIIILSIYFITLCIFIAIGVLGLCNYQKARFNGIKTRINLKNPFKTVLLNPGMVCFIVFFIFEIILQMIG